MASFMMDTKLSQIELSRGYGVNEFHEDIKKVCTLAGCEMKAVVFLFTDNQIVKESFVEDINTNPMKVVLDKRDALDWPHIHFVLCGVYTKAVLRGKAFIPPCEQK
jgi:hypothetical protein